MSHTISIVAIFRNEHRFIKEWLEYHLKVGVDHFYLYDNGGDHWDLIEPFKDQVTYHKWTDDVAEEFTKSQEQKLSRQTGAYTHCVINYKNETDWLQLIDLDEFLVPLKADSLKDCLVENVAVQRIPRINFGNSGHWKRNDRGSIQLYNRRERKPSHHKDMGRSGAVKKVKGPHTFIVVGEVVESSTMRVDHHYTRSLGEWLDRAKTGGGQKGMGFRVFIGKRKWLAYLAYIFLNVRSVHLFFFLLGLNLAFFLSDSSNQPILYLLNLPILAWMVFAFIRGQNEVKDTRLQDLTRASTSSNDLK